ncbi:hypothetical protein GH714_009671 [Hevea brasiliensis]|uniref:non-specific serine/threonine protein kinase n=1 Tax=Hevea brasiliensis TaxID=3981 RepID=A0A6A6M9I7_HEVBR|nr:hypothetical protein GH714_009671 [Hevea brasiliensis]
MEITDDPGIGDYSIELNPNGSPQAILYRGTKPFWRSSPWPAKQFVDIRNVSFINNQDEAYVTMDVFDASVIVRVKLDYSGLLMQLTWHESEGKWKKFWSVPDYRCESYGYCGAFGKCDPVVHVRRFECDCLPSVQAWRRVCRVASVKIPDTSEAVWLGLNMSPMDCELECTRNCSCSAYASIGIPEKGTGCLAWYGELMDTTINMEDGNNIYVRVDALELVRNKWNERLLDTINDAYPNDTLVANEGRTSHPDIAFFNLSTIITATNNFSPAKKVGQGGFGLVHEGQLLNGQEVAVKRLSKNSGQGIEEFKNEVMLISKLQHKNLVKLIGCCIQGEEPMLVYEYTNKSLDSFLFDFGLARVFNCDQIQEETDKIVGTLLIIAFNPFLKPLGKNDDDLKASRDTITINQTIQDGSLLISREKNFALGFFSPGSSRYRYLGIWYHKVREQTVVWVANRNHPINGSSGVLSINQYGNLILYSNHSQTIPVWSTNVSVEVTETDTCVAQLLDSGNLILVQEMSKRVVWESFDHPTDTHLPGMKLGLNRKTGIHQFLTSWRSADDPGTGDYSLQVNPKGSPQVILYRGTKRYWRSDPWPLKNYEIR